MIGQGIMAAVRKNKVSSIAAASPAARQEQKKLRQGVLLLIFLVILLAGCAVSLYLLRIKLFEKNPRFTLRTVQINSSGYWGRSKENRNALIRKLNLQPGKDNLFALNHAKLRQELRSLPNVADAKVKPQLPDMLEIEIEERIPRAFLGRSNSELVVDANGMVMESRQCFGVHPRLPVIVSLHNRGVKPGVIRPGLHDALALIMSIQRYECFSAALISLLHADSLTVTMDYRSGNSVSRYYVTMPRGNYPELLDILRSAIIDARRHRDDRNVVNLTFDGAVVMSYNGMHRKAAQ